MNLIQLRDYITNDCGGAGYIYSPRWKDRVVNLINTHCDWLPFISIDYSADEGLIGNTSTEIEYGNRFGKFLNSEEAVLYDDFEVLPYNEGLEKALSFKKTFEKKWRSKYGVN